MKKTLCLQELKSVKIKSYFLSTAEADSGGGADPPPHPYFLQSLKFFCNHFEELPIELSEVELIVNNAPLTYVCQNNIKTCLTPNHLLVNR